MQENLPKLHIPTLLRSLFQKEPAPQHKNRRLPPRRDELESSFSVPFLSVHWEKSIPIELQGPFPAAPIFIQKDDSTDPLEKYPRLAN